MKATEQQLALLIYSEEDRGMSDPVLRIRADVVSVEDGSKVRNLSTSSFDLHPAANLTTAAIYWAGENGGAFWDVEYRDVYSADVDAMVKRTRYLQKVTKSLAKRSEELGPSETFGEHVSRFAIAIGAVYCIWKWDDAKSGGWSHDDQHYNYSGSAGARRHVDELVRKFRAKHAGVSA